MLHRPVAALCWRRDALASLPDGTFYTCERIRNINRKYAFINFTFCVISFANIDDIVFSSPFARKLHTKLLTFDSTVSRNQGIGRHKRKGV